MFLLFIATADYVDDAVSFVSVAVVTASMMLSLLFLLLRLLFLFVVVVGVVNIVVIAFHGDDNDDDDTTIYYSNTKCVLIIHAKCFSSKFFYTAYYTLFKPYIVLWEKYIPRCQ